MKVTILSQYYPPETGAPQNRLSDLARRMTTAGYEVTVLTAKPSYPTGRIERSFRGGLWKIRRNDSGKVIHCWLYPSRSRRAFLRLVNYFSFVLSSIVIGTILLPRADILIVESPPIFLGLSAWFLSRLKRAKLVFNVSDLYPQTAIELGYLRPGLFARTLFAFEEWCYRSSVLVTGQTQGIVMDIKRRFPSVAVLLVTNGINVEDFDSYDFGSKRVNARFTLGYAGIHGHAQGLDSILEAARCLELTKAQVRLEFWGDGPLREELEHKARVLKLSNVEFFGHRSRKEVINRMKAWDAGIVSLVDKPLMGGALPSKIFEIMAASLPVLLAAPKGEASSLIESANAGVRAEAENSESIADAILRLSLDREGARQMGVRGRAFVLENFDRSRIAATLMSTLESVVTS